MSMPDFQKTRPYTNATLDAIDAGAIDPAGIISSLLMWLTDDSVKQWLQANDHQYVLKKVDGDDETEEESDEE